MISADRIMGFIEGEGCFGVAIYKVVENRLHKTSRKNILIKKKTALGYQIKLSFRISLARKDRNILDEIKETFELGYVYDVKENLTRSPVCQYAVQSTEDLLKLIEFFDLQTFYTTKGQSYQHWKEIVQMVNRKEHLSKEGFLKVCELREKMNLVFNKEKHLRSRDFLAEAISRVNRVEDRDVFERPYDFEAILAMSGMKKCKK